MRKTLLHRRATAYLRRMPATRRNKMLDALEQVAELKDISGHTGIRPMSGNYKGWYLLRGTTAPSSSPGSETARKCYTSITPARAATPINEARNRNCRGRI